MPPRWRSRQRIKIFQLSLRYRSNLARVGAPLNREFKQFGCFLMSLKSSHTFSLVFEGDQIVRTQEFVLRASSNPEGPFREIVRQQWNFSPPETAREGEEYQVELSNVTVLELIIVPNVSGGAARASLKSLRLS